MKSNDPPTAAVRAIRSRLRFGFRVASVAREFAVPIEFVQEEKRKLRLARQREGKPKLTPAQQRKKKRAYLKKWRFKRDLKAMGLSDAKIRSVMSNWPE